MSLRYGFFDSEITGYDDEGMPEFDRAESSDFLALFISSIVANGVLASPGDCFQVVAGDGMSVSVTPGFGIIQGRFAYDDEAYVLTLDDADTLNTRIDRIVLRANYPDRKCEIVVHTGTPSMSPVGADLLRTGDYYELCLAEINVKANISSVSQAYITDTRADTSLCGWVTQAISQVDTETLFLQWQDAYKNFYDNSNAEFENWLDSMRDQLGDEVVSTLTNMINQKADKESVDKFEEEVTNTVDGLAEKITKLESEKTNVGVTEALEKSVADLQSKKANNAVVSQANILSTGWEGDAAPYTNTLAVSGVTANSIVLISLQAAATMDQVKGWAYAQLEDGGQAENSLTLMAYGKMPTINLPINITIWN